MSEHVREWLNAYLDCELKGDQLEKLRLHLKECTSCQAELHSLEEVSQLVKGVPFPNDLADAKDFTNRLMLGLPARKLTAPRRDLRELGWWLVPVGILSAWVFIQTVVSLSGWVSTAGSFGLLKDVSAWLFPSSSASTWIATILYQLGLLTDRAGLQWVLLGENFSRNLLASLGWQVSLALLYLGWLVSWLTRHKRSEVLI